MINNVFRKNEVILTLEKLFFFGEMNKFEHIRVLGRGAFGAANLVKRKNDGKLFAIKTIGARNELAGMTDKEKETAMKEADVLRDLNFLHIVK